MRRKVNSYEESYFNNWYKGTVGAFARRDLIKSRRWFWSWLNYINNFVSIKYGENKTALEVGCSIGGVVSLLVDRGYHVFGSDVSSYVVKKAKKLIPNATFLKFDIQRGVPIKRKFDLVIAFEVVEHLRHPRKAIINIRKVLKKNGHIVFSSPYPYPWAYKDPTHVNVKHPEVWKDYLLEIGFKNVIYRKISLVPYFYKFHQNLQIVIPFHIPLSFINNLVIFIGTK